MRKSGMMKSLLLVLVFASSVVGEGLFDKIKKGNEASVKGDYKTALQFYHDAETDLPESPELEYNIANALHLDGGYEEAVEKYQGALNTLDIATEAQAHYNLGNTQFRMQDYQNAIQSYQKALEINSADMDAKYNLELARRMLKEQMQQQEKEQQPQDQQQEQEQQQQEQQEQEQQDQQQEQEQQQQQQEQEQQQEQQNQQSQPQPQDQKEMSKEDAERILNALRDDEKEIQKKMKRRQASGDYVGKDW